MLTRLLRNLPSFLLALVLAISVWAMAVSAADPDETAAYPRPLPLEILGQDPGLVIIGTPQKTITITLRAPRSIWQTINTGEGRLRALVDLAGLTAGRHQVRVQIQTLDQPIRIITFSPEIITIELEQLSSRTLPIEIVLAGEAAVGFKTEPSRPQPREVVLSGPKSLVERASRAEIIININGARNAITETSPLRILDANGNLLDNLSLAPGEARVNIPVTQQGGYRDIAVKVVLRGQVANGYRLTNISIYPPVVTVFSNDPALVNTLPGFVETESLSLNGADENIETRVGLLLPANISLVGEQTVQIQVGIAAIEGSLSLNNMPVEVVGLESGYTAAILPQTVDIILTGPLPILDKLTANDVKILADLTGLAPGTHQVIPIAQIIINDIEVKTINPAAIEVIITVETNPEP